MDGVLCYPTLLAIVKVVAFLSLCNELFSIVPPPKKNKKSSRISSFMSFFGGSKIYIYWIPQIKLT